MMKLLIGPFSVFSIQRNGIWSEYVYRGKGELSAQNFAFKVHHNSESPSK
jgi:hypothetical protein